MLQFPACVVLRLNASVAQHPIAKLRTFETLEGNLPAPEEGMPDPFISVYCRSHVVLATASTQGRVGCVCIFCPHRSHSGSSQERCGRGNPKPP